MSTGRPTASVTQVRGLFKDVKVNGKRAVEGNLAAKSRCACRSARGSVSKRLQGNGKLVARDGELTNVDLINKIERVTGMIGLSKDERRQATTFKTLEADFILGGGYAEFTRLYLINPQMEVSGHGTMTLEQPTLISRSARLFLHRPQRGQRAPKSRLFSATSKAASWYR